MILPIPKDTRVIISIYLFIKKQTKQKPTTAYAQMDHNNERRFTYNGRIVNDWVKHNLIYSSLDDPKSQMHELAVKQPYESLLILLRYRTNGHNTSVDYCMGETAIVYITVVILLTPHTPNENAPYVAANEKWALCQNRHYHCDRKTKMHTNQVLQSRDCNMKVYRWIIWTIRVREGMRSNPNYYFLNLILIFLVKYKFLFFLLHAQKNMPHFFFESPP